MTMCLYTVACYYMVVCSCVSRWEPEAWGSVWTDSKPASRASHHPQPFSYQPAPDQYAAPTFLTNVILRSSPKCCFPNLTASLQKVPQQDHNTTSVYELKKAMLFTTTHETQTTGQFCAEERWQLPFTRWLSAKSRSCLIIFKQNDPSEQKISWYDILRMVLIISQEYQLIEDSRNL